ncbi:MAG TPA: peptidase [Alphaproteobacteria bacterium]
MTYCVAIQLDKGLVFAADSRTHAGVDNIASFRKMTVWQPGDRVIVMLSAGNLALTQSVVTLLDNGVDTGGGAKESFLTVPDMYGAARLAGSAIREIYRLDGPALRTQGADFNVSFILGGQIGQGGMRLFQIYSAGNFIEATRETPYFQMGEVKYGKPIIDRIIRPSTSLRAAAKCALISMDSTLRSNLSVGMPVDLAIHRKDAAKLAVLQQIEETDHYFRALRQAWMDGLRNAFKELPDPAWLNGGD